MLAARASSLLLLLCEGLGNPPDSVQHAGGDVLPSGQTEHPDATDSAQRHLWDGGAAPGSVSLHEVVLGHVPLLLRLLQNSVSLQGVGAFRRGV